MASTAGHIHFGDKEMTIKTSVFIAASLDGFIARPDGDIDWLHRPEYAAHDGDDWGYGNFIASVDALVMGRHSFEKVLSFPSWPYDGTPVVVLTSRKLAIPAHLSDKVEPMSAAPAALVEDLAARGKEHLYIDGGITIQRFLRAGLIDEITLTQIPVLLGDGLPLFAAIGREIVLELIDSRHGDNGFVQSRYLLLYNETTRN
jgi:dihydrofolate reductase